MPGSQHHDRAGNIAQLGMAWNSFRIIYPPLLPSTAAQLLTERKRNQQLVSLSDDPISYIQSFLRALLPSPLSAFLDSISNFLQGLFMRLTQPNNVSVPVINEWAYPDDIPGLRTSDDAALLWPKRYQALYGKEFWQYFKYLAVPQVRELKGGRSTHALNFQPSPTAKTQDRYVVRELDIRGRIWTLTGVFDGHLGECTVDHVAHHLPIIVEEFLTAEYDRDPTALPSPDSISDLLSQSIVSFDNAIASDVLDLFGGTIESLDNYSDSDIRDIINDQHRGGNNWKKARLGMYGCCSVVALIDPGHENLWIANIGDCQAIMVSPTDDNGWDVEVMTTEHNGSNDAEIERVRKDHPEEPNCVKNRRVLGVLAPFRCLGDVPFKQPPAFSRRIIYNIAPGFRDVSPWEAFLELNHTPPYITAQPEITHRRLTCNSSSKDKEKGVAKPRFLILASDGFSDICSSSVKGQKEIIACWAKHVDEVSEFEVDGGLASSNRAMRLLWHALGGRDESIDVSKVLTLEMDEAWIDDTSIVVQMIN